MVSDKGGTQLLAQVRCGGAEGACSSEKLGEAGDREWFIPVDQLNSIPIQLGSS